MSAYKEKYPDKQQWESQDCRNLNIKNSMQNLYWIVQHYLALHKYFGILSHLYKIMGSHGYKTGTMKMHSKKWKQKYTTVPIVCSYIASYSTMAIPVAVQLMAWVCRSLLAGNADTNSSGGLDVCQMWVLYVVRYRSQRWADPLSIVLPSVMRCSMWSKNLTNDAAIACVGLLRQSVTAQSNVLLKNYLTVVYNHNNWKPNFTGLYLPLSLCWLLYLGLLRPWYKGKNCVKCKISSKQQWMPALLHLHVHFYMLFLLQT